MWGPCPSGQWGRECTTLINPLDPSNPSDARQVRSFLRRGFAGDAATDKTLWMVPGGPGISSNGYGGAGDYFISLDPSITVYLLDLRGISYSNPVELDPGVPIACPFPPGSFFNPYDPTNVAIFQACNDWNVENFGDVMQFYTMYYAAVDFKIAIDAVNPGKIAIYAQSCGTFLVNSYLQLANARADAVLLDGPVAPDRWSLEDNAQWAEKVSQDILLTCVQNSTVCRGHLGDRAHLARYTMDQIIDETLPCLSKLPWLQQADGHLLISFWSNILSSGEDNVKMLGPFWKRLQRCSDSDVVQLNFFRGLTLTPPPPQSTSDYSYFVATVSAVADLYSRAPAAKVLTYADQVIRSSRAMTDAGPEYTLSLARETYPVFPPSPFYMKYANPSMPVLVMVGTFDCNTPNGLGVYMSSGLGKNAQLVNVPFASHGLLSAAAMPCTSNMILSFLLGFGSNAVDATCMSEIPFPDFDGSEDATKDTSFMYFGTRDLWNDGGQIDVEKAPAGGDESGGDEWKNRNVFLLGLLIPTVVFGGVVTFFLLRWAPKPSISKQFGDEPLMKYGDDH